MPELEIGLADGSELNLINLSCSLMQKEKYRWTVLPNLNLNAE